MRKFVCDAWRPALDAGEKAIANSDGQVCTERRYVSSIELATKTQCLEPLLEALLHPAALLGAADPRADPGQVMRTT